MSPIQLVVAAKASPFNYGIFTYKKLRDKQLFKVIWLHLGVLAVADYINSVKKDSVVVELRDIKNLEGASKPSASISYNG